MEVMYDVVKGSRITSVIIDGIKVEKKVVISSLHDGPACVPDLRLPKAALQNMKPNHLKSSILNYRFSLFSF